ncbi:glycerophosphoryl diester phosphodiesterase [Roseinatronobacter thiooxidans]|uniref:Glycerophosphoryl diester phosphodiesterase n=1 Tax=Roseinatronobacter thiooxidans TaxID=121821 RepID=A0A2W7Q8Y3_9RHOB|nr:glycerophosphodiester phosphodiesterase [Roseinatronobacter thiooxidans]PZX44553.1 glycerophosphoryl diester phosphodiesterase [Roseinatronobacter thiooxidans]
MTHAETSLFLTSPTAMAIAHRGGALEGEENTMPAFSHAVSLGYTHMELDVHATRDGEVVIHHDPDLNRIFNDPRLVAQMDYADLRKLRSRGGAEIPRLEDLLAAYPDICLAIEAKSRAVVAPLCALIQRLGATERVSIGAFDPACTAQARALLGPRLLWSPAHAQVARLWARGWGLPLALADFRVVQVPAVWKGVPVVTPRFVRAAHQAGVAVQVWTVNDRAQMVQLLDMGVDGLMTDRPTMLRDVLITRGAWPSSAR